MYAEWTIVLALFRLHLTKMEVSGRIPLWQTEQQFTVLGRYVRTKIEKIRSSILEGDARVSPYELGKKNACTYCPYMTVCGFDRKLSGI